uniref:Si:dkey-103g5.3 n=1 Tax=Neogobius melanostomus TaxID=47308 RepID=A0A8C6T505_9GOBI
PRMYVGLPLLAVLLQPALSVYNCSSEYNRTPDNSDLAVDCGATTITLEINLCTVQWAGFSTADLALNGNHNNQECLGTADDTVEPPVMRYHLPVNHSLDNPCRQSLQVTSFALSFASVQSVIITGYIETPRPDQGMISYATDLYYHFSCRYPLEYLLNNMQIVASSVSVATNDNNGTFIDTLKMSVFNDSTFQYPLIVPPAGLQLRDSVFVEVKANVTGNFYVLLDHCFGTPTTYNAIHSEHLYLSSSCSVDARTTVISNGVSKVSRFTFEAFRFLEHRIQSKSSVFLHCLLRLCVPSKCPEILGCNSKRKRSVTPFGQESGDSATVSAGPLFTAAEGKKEHDEPVKGQPDAKSNSELFFAKTLQHSTCSGIAVMILVFGQAMQPVGV